MPVTQIFPFLLVLLGFVALLLQRVYVRDEKGGASEITLPILGKMKTNFPALIFVFCGVATFIYLVDLESRQKDDWVFNGKLELDSKIANLGSKVDLREGRVQLNPRFEESWVDTGNMYHLRVRNPNRTPPHKFIDRLNYSLKLSEFCQLFGEIPGASLGERNARGDYRVDLTLRLLEDKRCEL